jgi:hypothetical protein
METFTTVMSVLGPILVLAGGAYMHGKLRGRKVPPGRKTFEEIDKELDAERIRRLKEGK